MESESRKMYLESFTASRMVKETEVIYHKLYDNAVKKIAA
jgi:NADPH-dependent 7-cyano-7-deazaguanine reductase QueF-like protein